VKRRRQAAVAVVLLLGLALVFRREPAPGPTGGWIAKAGLVPQFESVDGVRLRYVRAGTGPAVVLLHGFASSIFTWRDVLPELARGHDVVAVDLPNSGGSAIRPDLPPAAYPRLVMGLMDRLGLGRASLVGNSLGGGTAVLVAAQHPEHVDRLVLIDSVGYNLAARDRPWVLRAAGLPPLARLLEALPVRRAVVTLALRQVFFDDRLVTADRIDEYVSPLLRPGAVAAGQALLAGSDEMGFPGVVAQVRAPTLVIWGREDAWVPVEDADRFLADIPGSRKLVIEGCGHLPQEERPAEVLKLLEDFLPVR
jgi:4,5:9,10-diseco-3-hydroxy-5,9,17-trioxoandrosta-1(10),2-diene-4-oate hydrolase